MPVTFNLAALPVAAGLMAGTGAVAAYVVGPTSAPIAVSAAPVAVSPPVQAAAPLKRCEDQTWPYIDNRCIAGAAQKDRKVRLVIAPRDGEAVTEIPVPARTAPASAAQGQLVTRDVMGRPAGNAAPAAMPFPRDSKRVEKRRVGDERRLAREAYQVPFEAGGRRDMRPVIVVRPLRLDMFR